MITKFKNASEAFDHMMWAIPRFGVDFADTKALFNIGFTIENPDDNAISAPERQWKAEYAEAEWQWYLSGDRSVAKLGEIYGKVPEIWKRMADYKGNVNSNYGWQWQRNGQLDKVIDQLQNNPDTKGGGGGGGDKRQYLFTMVKRYRITVTIHRVLMLYSLRLWMVSLTCVLQCDLMISGTASAMININFHLCRC